MERREFLKASAKVAGLAVMAGVAGRVGLDKLPVEFPLANKAQYRLKPVEGVHYSEGFLDFMTRARFDSATAAARAVRKQTTLFYIEVASGDGHFA